MTFLENRIIIEDNYKNKYYELMIKMHHTVDLSSIIIMIALVIHF